VTLDLALADTLINLMYVREKEADGHRFIDSS
jgi:hypothetical protein